MFDQTDGCAQSKTNNNEKGGVDRYIKSSVNLKPRNTNFDYMDKYKNGNPYTGLALIFNHIKIEDQEDRTGTEKDFDQIYESLKNYGFEIRSYIDQKFEKIKSILKAVAKEEHYDNDCLVVVVMSHGQPGRIFAKDVPYLIKELWKPFTGDRCASLIDKPKLFFIQSCRGCNPEKGVNYPYDSTNCANSSITVDALSEPVTYSIPATADILLSFSTFESRYSCRDTANGTWYIQSLAKVLDDAAENQNGTELYAILLRVARIVAYKHEFNDPEDQEKHEMKQMPAIVSTLTKKFFLKKKDPKIK